MRILVATDAWRPQVNGVVRTYERLQREMATLGGELALMTPDEFRTVPCPSYPEVRLSLPRMNYVAGRLDVMRPDAVHIATEGPIGWMVRRFCLKRGLRFTTAFHTKFPDYIHARFGIPRDVTFAMQRLFHNSGAGMMVSTRSLASELRGRGFQRVLPWTRGVDTDMFRPREVRLFGSEQPVFLYVGRVAVEKNIDAFLALDLPGRKVVVGDGPLLAQLRVRYPDVLFVGHKSGEELAQCYASADVFVMPSRTETFGIVLLEAIASGVPVAAFPVTGPLDNIEDGVTGALDHDLATACRRALALDRRSVREAAQHLGWDRCARMFVQNIEDAIFLPTGRRFAPKSARVARSRLIGPA